MPSGVYTRRRKSLADRFWAKVDKDGPTPDHCPERGPCWLWTSARTPNGYGRINPGDASTLYAHHLSYRLHFGPIPRGLDVCHHCDVRHCVAPHHFFIGTRADNMADMAAKGRGHGPGLFGERHPQAKLSDDDVRSIRARVADGESRGRVARSFGVTVTTISRIVERKNWAHVD